MDEDEKYQRAKEKVELLKSFYIHASVYVLVNILLFIFNLLVFDGYWWFLYPLGGWGIGLVIHAFLTFSGGIFGRKWEEKKIKEFMDKDEE